MSTKLLTQQNLTLALTQNKAYIGVKPFIQAFASGDLKILSEIINPVFVTTLTSDKASLMSKLLVLRMYKDIFLIGNMEMFDQIDPVVQESIISAAAYNPKFRSKGKKTKQTRGGMYFIQLQKRPKNTQSLQLGNSFVLFSTEIIKFFASCLPQYPVNQQSRFFGAYQELQGLGVKQYTNIYIQEDEKHQFFKNYRQWAHQRAQKSNNNRLEAIQQDAMILKPKQGLQITKQRKNSHDITFQQGYLKKQETYCELLSSEMMKIEDCLKKKCKQIQDLKNQYKQLQSENQIIKVKMEQYLCKIDQLQKQILQQKSLEQNQKQESQRKSIEIQKLLKKIEELNNQIQVNRIQEQLKNKQMEQKNQIFQKERDQFNNKITLMEEHLQVVDLQKIKFNENIQNSYNFKGELLEGRKNEERLENLIKQREQQLDKKKKMIDGLLQKIQLLQFQMAQNTKIGSKVNQDIFVKQIKMGQGISKQKRKSNFQLRQPNLPISYQQLLCVGTQPSKPKDKELKNFMIDKNDSCNFLSYTEHEKRSFFQQPKKTKHSLHKTQSSKFRQQYSYTKQRKSNPLKQSSSNNINNSFACRNGNKFCPKGEKFYPLYSPNNKNIVTCLFPFIQEYFPISMHESKHFRASCISSQARQWPFYQNDLVQLRIVEEQIAQSKRVFSLLIKNIHSLPISIQVGSQNQEIKVQNSGSYFKISSFEKAKVKFEAHVTNLNFRFPIFNFVIHFQGPLNQSLDNRFSLPIPLTLLSFTQITQKQKQINQFDRYHENTYKRHKSQKIVLNSCIKSLPSLFPELNFCRLKNQDLQAKGILWYPYIRGIKIKLILTQNLGGCQFQTEFFTNSKISEAFSKVLLQALMFVCS